MKNNKTSDIETATNEPTKPVNESFFVDMTMRSYGVSYNSKKCALTIILEGDVPVDSGDWERTAGRPYGEARLFYDPTTGADGEYWTFVLPLLNVSDSSTRLQLKETWSMKLPAEPAKAAIIKEERCDMISDMLKTVERLFGEQLAGRSLVVQFFSGNKPQREGTLL